MKITALTLGSALLVSTLAWGPALAMPIGSGVPTVAKEANANIVTVDDEDALIYGGALLGGVLLGSALSDYDDDDYGDDDYDDVDDHVAYCLNRYRSYHVRSDTYMGYDGYRHRCNSPY
jgi:hypothetical protein